MPTDCSNITGRRSACHSAESLFGTAVDVSVVYEHNSLGSPGNSNTHALKVQIIENPVANNLIAL